MMMTQGQQPDASKVSPAMKDAILHARMELGETELLGIRSINATLYFLSQSSFMTHPQRRKYWHKSESPGDEPNPGTKASP